MGSRLGERTAGLIVGMLLLAACSGGGGSSGSGGKVELSFWSWVPNLQQVVATWNAAHPNSHGTARPAAQGDALVTKLLTAAKAGNPPNLAQLGFQSLPTLISNGVVADISGRVGSVK